MATRDELIAQAKEKYRQELILKAKQKHAAETGSTVQFDGRTVEVNPEASYTESASRGAAQGLSFGFADEFTGGVQAAYDAARKMSTADIVKDYIKRRDAYRAADKIAEQANPLTYNAGQLGAGVATAFVPGLGWVKGGNALLNGAKLLGSGAVNAVGLSEAETVPELAQDAATGAGWAGAFGIGGHVLSKAVPTAQKAGAYAKKKAVEHLRPTPKVARVLGPERLGEIGQEALDSGAIKFGNTARDTAENLAIQREQVGAQIQEIIDNSGATVDPVAVANRIENEVIGPLRGIAEFDDIVKLLEAKKTAFLAKHAPGYTPGGRAPGTPTTITRSKPQFVPEEPKVAFDDGLQQIGETRTPRAEIEMVDTAVPDPVNLGMKQGQEMRVYHTGEDVKPVMGYSTPEPSAPFATDPRTGLPIKRISERRIEGVPNVEQIPVGRLEAEKRAAQGKINYHNDPKASQEAQMSYASTLRQASEDAIQNPAFPQAKDKFGKIAEAQAMAERTAGLTDSGTGLLGTLHDLNASQLAMDALLRGEPLTGTAIAGGRALVRGRANSALAVGADRASKFLSSNPRLDAMARGAENVIRQGAPVMGRQMGEYTKKDFDSDAIISRLQSVPGAQRFVGALQNAAERGPDAVATTHFILSQTEPEYQKAVQE